MNGHDYRESTPEELDAALSVIDEIGVENIIVYHEDLVLPLAGIHPEVLEDDTRVRLMICDEVSKTPRSLWQFSVDFARLANQNGERSIDHEYTTRFCYALIAAIRFKRITEVTIETLGE